MGIGESTPLYIHRLHGGKLFDRQKDDQSILLGNEAGKPRRKT